MTSASDSPSVSFYKVNGKVIPVDSVDYFDFDNIVELKACLYLKSGVIIEAEGSDALELAMQTRPSVLEGKRLKFAKRAWLIHNLVGHPLMQFFALIGNYRKAFEIHEATVPKPINFINKVE